MKCSITTQKLFLRNRISVVSLAWKVFKSYLYVIYVYKPRLCKHKLRIYILSSLHKSHWHSTNIVETLLCVNTFHCDFNQVSHQPPEIGIVSICQSMGRKNLKLNDFPKLHLVWSSALRTPSTIGTLHFIVSLYCTLQTLHFHCQEARPPPTIRL